MSSLHHLDKGNLSVFPHHRHIIMPFFILIFNVFMTPFQFATFKIYCKSTYHLPIFAHLLITLPIFAHLLITLPIFAHLLITLPIFAHLLITLPIFAHLLITLPIFAHLLITLPIFAHLQCIQFSQDLHNTSITIVYATNTI